MEKRKCSMESMGIRGMNNLAFFKGKKVFLTGHTGFKSLDNYKNVMSKESKLIDEGEIRKNILDKAANKILALPFPEQAVFHLYYAFHLDDSQINEILMIPYAHGMRISMLN